MASTTAQALSASLKQWNTDKNLAWDLGTNYSNVGTQFETYVNKYLFPKLSETLNSTVDLGNRFNFLAKETPYISQLTEEYVVLDSVPVDLNLDREETLLLKRTYPKMATRLYGQGVHKKQKFTLNDNENRLNWSTLADAIKYAVQVYQKRISDINVDEEREYKAMLIDYALNHMSPTTAKSVKGIEEFTNAIFESVLNVQNNSADYNEASIASGGAIGRYTTQTPLKDVLIVTTDAVKAYLLDTKIANTFQVAGLDLTNHIISFDNLGGNYMTNSDVTLTANDVTYMSGFGDYQARPGDVIQKGVVFTYDISKAPSFKKAVTELKPTDDFFAMILDIRGLYYKRNTQKLNPVPFYNGEFDEYTYFMHYYSFKAISPFYNKVVVKGTKEG